MNLSFYIHSNQFVLQVEVEVICRVDHMRHRTISLQDYADPDSIYNCIQNTPDERLATDIVPMERSVGCQVS
jgi:hypothetical protein